jgi:hypothetical protein
MMSKDTIKVNRFRKGLLLAKTVLTIRTNNLVSLIKHSDALKTLNSSLEEKREWS